jgi:hypothetical protein
MARPLFSPPSMWMTPGFRLGLAKAGLPQQLCLELVDSRLVAVLPMVCTPADASLHTLSPSLASPPFSLRQAPEPAGATALLAGPQLWRLRPQDLAG